MLEHENLRLNDADVSGLYIPDLMSGMTFGWMAQQTYLSPCGDTEILQIEEPLRSNR